MKTALLMIFILNLGFIAESVTNVTIVVNLNIRYCRDGFFQCSSGECIPDDQVCNGSADCPDGSDEKALLCGATCSSSAIESLSIKLRCADQELKLMPCPEYVPPGTIAQLSCKDGYRKQSSSALEAIHCQKSGTWSDHTLKCEPACGELDNDKQVPWYVTIYQLRPGSHRNICGGSIISTRVVLTAAYFFWNDTQKSANNIDNYAAFAGKTKKDYNAEEPEAQKLSIKSIEIHPQYNDLAYLRADIAVLILDEPIIFRNTIKPVCLNFDIEGTQKDIIPSTNGRLTGMSFKNDSDLKFVHISTNECASKSFASRDAYCLESVFTENVCFVFSGSGFVVPKKKLEHVKPTYFLRGIVSQGAGIITACSVENYAPVTDILQYKDFIKKYV